MIFKKIFIVVVSTLLLFQIFGQDIKAKSSISNYDISEKAKPILWEFVGTPTIYGDKNNDGILDALENITVKFKIKNLGPGNGNNLKLKIEPTKINSNSTDNFSSNIYDFGLKYLNLDQKIPDIRANEEKELFVFIESNKQLKSGSISFSLSITEPNGFGSKDPLLFNIKTKEYIPPKIIINESSCSCASDIMEENDKCSIKVKFKNIGDGIAESLKLTVKEGEFVNFFSGKSSPSFKFDQLMPGAEDSVKLDFIVSSNNNGNDVRFDIEITELFDEYGSNTFKVISIGENLETESSRIRKEQKKLELIINRKKKKLQCQIK